MVLVYTVVIQYQNQCGIHKKVKKHRSLSFQINRHDEAQIKFSSESKNNLSSIVVIVVFSIVSAATHLLYFLFFIYLFLFLAYEYIISE